jgi:6-pyruvoyltetrahydropterin/6-carboxytetrahydropterin synthase
LGCNSLSIIILVFVTRQAHFNAAHRLHNPDKSDEWNASTFGKCNYPNWHGHNYVIKVTVAGLPDPETGYVIDLGKLKQIMKDQILDPCDHRNLNIDVPFLKGIIPTSENLVIAFYNQLKEQVEAVASEGSVLYSVELFETERNIAEYCPFRQIDIK